VKTVAKIPTNAFYAIAYTDYGGSTIARDAMHRLGARCGIDAESPCTLLDEDSFHLTFLGELPENQDHSEMD
jgi:hypothetical protein